MAGLRCAPIRQEVLTRYGIDIESARMPRPRVRYPRITAENARLAAFTLSQEEERKAAAENEKDTPAESSL
jgi:hypothetical protein